MLIKIALKKSDNIAWVTYFIPIYTYYMLIVCYYRIDGTHLHMSDVLSQ